MSSEFSKFWKNTGGRLGKAAQLVVEYESAENGKNTRVFETECEYAEWLLEMGQNVKILGIRKGAGFSQVGREGLVQKPGNSVHTAKWDRCVSHVKANSPDADPYAVCTAMLGDESFKSLDEQEFNGLIDKALGQMGISAAGPIPESKLSRQDLEGTTSKKAISGFTPAAELVSRIKSNQKVTVTKGGSFRDAWSKIKPR